MQICDLFRILYIHNKEDCVIIKIIIMKKPKLKKYPTGGSKGFIQDKLVHYVGQGESPYTREQLKAMGYNYETTTDGFDEYSMGDNRRFYKTVLPNSPGWNNPENPYLTNTAKPAVAKVGHKTGPYPSYGSPEYIQAHPEYTPPKPRIPTFAGGGEFAPIPEKDSLYIEDRLKKDPYLSAKYKYKVVEDRKKGDILYRTMPNGKDVPVNFNNMKELDRQAYKVKMDRDLQSTGQKPIYNVFAPPTFKHGGMKLPKYLPGGEYESTSMIEDYRAEDGSSFWDGANGQESYYKSQEPVASAADQQQIDNNKPNYGAIAGATTGAVANSMVAYNRPDTNVSMKAEANRNGVAAIAGSINPMVGGIIGGVNAIAKPIKANNERTDSQGNLVNQNGAQASAIVGGLMSPSSAFTAMSDGKWDLTGKKYANSLEADARARIAEEKAPELAAAAAKRNMYYTYAQGGVHSGMPNAELENKEMYNIPGGPISEVNGPSHKQGGVPVSIPNGTEMLPDNSDSLKINTKIVKMFPNLFSKKDIGKTFSDTSRNLKTTKEDKIMKDDKASNMSKSTASLNIEVKKAIYQQKMKALEEFKKSKLQDYAKKLGVTLPQAQEGAQEGMQSPFTGEGMEEGMQYSKGGTKLPKFDGGMRYIDPKNLQLAQQAQSGFPTMEEVEDPSFNNALYNKYQTPFIRPSEAERLKNERSNSKQQYVPNPNDPYEQAMAAGKEFEQPAKQVNPKTGNYDWVEPTANTLMQNAGNIAYLAGEGKKYDKQDFYKYNPELYNPADALRQADIEANVNRNRLKDASGGNAGALMSNLTQSQAINTLLKSKIRTDAANQNAGTLNDAQVRNIQGKYNVDDINARNKGQALTNYYNAIRGIGQNTSGAYKDWKRGEVDQQTLDIISKNYPDYVYDKRRKGWYHKSTDKKLE